MIESRPNISIKSINIMVNSAIKEKKTLRSDRKKKSTVCFMEKKNF